MLGAAQTGAHPRPLAAHPRAPESTGPGGLGGGGESVNFGDDLGGLSVATWLQTNATTSGAHIAFAPVRLGGERG